MSRKSTTSAKSLNNLKFDISSTPATRESLDRRSGLFYWCTWKACFHKGINKKERSWRSEFRLSLVRPPKMALALPTTGGRATLPPLLKEAFWTLVHKAFFFARSERLPSSFLSPWKHFILIRWLFYTILLYSPFLPFVFQSFHCFPWNFCRWVIPVFWVRAFLLSFC